MCSPSLLVTNHEAQSFPSIKHEVGLRSKHSHLLFTC